MYPFTDGSFAVRNAWYVAAFGNEVGRALLARTILNQPVVLYRKEDGEAVAIGGRCPHRHFPLGKGCLKGDTVECGYHGIVFGPNGQCVDVPSQTTVPRSLSIPTYPLVEHGLWLFIWMGDPAKADRALLPDLGEIGLTDRRLVTRPFFSETIQGRYQLFNDNLLDLTHLAYLHEGNIGMRADATSEETLSRRPGVFTSRRKICNADGPAELMKRLGHEGKVDRITEMSFYLPYLHCGIDALVVPRDHPSHAGQVLTLSRVFHAVTPATRHSCNYLFAMGIPHTQSFEGTRAFIRPVVDEDKFATEEIEKMLALVGENPGEFLLKSDRNAVEARRALQAMMDAEATTERVACQN